MDAECVLHCSFEGKSTHYLLVLRWAKRGVERLLLTAKVTFAVLSFLYFIIKRFESA